VIDKQGYKVIDADAHLVETEDSWNYLEGSDKKFKPQLFQSDENPSTKLWILDGKPIGFRKPTLTEMELKALQKETGRTLETSQNARELRDVELRLQHMDKLGIEVQILLIRCGLRAWRISRKPRLRCVLLGIAGWLRPGRKERTDWVGRAWFRP